MLPIEEVTLGCSYEELTAVRVGTGVGLEDAKIRKTTTWTAVPLTEDLNPYASPGSFRPDNRLSTDRQIRNYVGTNREILPIYRE